MKKIFTVILFLFSLQAHANPDVSVLKWQEETQLTTSGKTSEVFIQGKIKNLPANQVMTSFAISFDEKQNLKITRVICDNQLADYSFLNNSLKIKFPKPKETNGSFALYFTYEETYDKINKFLRQEAIYIPNFAAGADAQVTINFPGYLESATLNPNITKNGGSFVYRNSIPENGVQEIIKLTTAQSVWDMAINVTIKSDQPLNDVQIKMPNYFQNGGQKVENLSTKSNITKFQEVSRGEDKIYKFNTAEKEILIESRAKIFTGTTNRLRVTRNPNDYLDVPQDEAALLSPILEKIKRDEKYRDLPLYAKIGKFVHEFLKYDISYTGKLPKVKEILRNPIGVCTEYSRLYNGLARVAKIPAMLVDGAACGEYDKCQGHAWNRIYQDGEWIDVDATWDLMSGIVSSSHVYFNDDGKGEISTRYFGGQRTVSSSMGFEMKNGSYTNSN